MPTKVSSVLILFLENIPFLMLFMKSKMQTFYLKLGIEGLMFLAAVASLMVPLIIGIVVLDPASFMHRLFLSLFNIRLRLELKILPLIFLIVFFNLQISNVIFHYLGCGLLYIYAAIAWLKTVEVSRVQNKGITRWKKCDLVSNTEDNLNFLQTYRQLQLVDLWVNVIYGNFLLSVHFAGTFVISLATSFLLIRMPGQVSPAMSIFALAGLLSCVSIVYGEVLLAEMVSSSCEMFIRACTSKFRKKSVKGKLVASLWTIRFRSGRPFFLLGRHSFLRFLNELLYFLATLLIATK
ncbi:uncharacterized protein LOC118438231 isoform X1 [Folsomia candida]|uniref:uncharacterized protein LOC118438231 isoform X1 n=1 Tax=Folsomia candida TaxID=158441 RepID=UPI001604AEC9|nr:uncharacterized protein LOC118438231 isoform X1 [Folsomia candida]